VARRGKTPRDILARKENRLDWARFNFLENLMVFCALPSRRVPAESGVQFQVSSRAKERSVCLVFEIDRRSDPLMDRAGPKPDYMVLHAAREQCICTIVEMKGREEKNVEHAVEQIKALYRRLREEIHAHLPGACLRAIKIQGILLTPYNAQIPLQKLKKEAAAGLTIVPLQYHRTAEIYPYVSKLNVPTERYQHDDMLPHEPDERAFNYLEAVLGRCALQLRLDGTPDRAGQGVRLTYARPDGPDEHHALLAVQKGGANLAVPEHSRDFLHKVRAELQRLGLTYKGLKLITLPGSPSP
jgi:hypothetical protein